ncbi:MAG: ComF family protein [Desulfobacterales bacterium]|nr:ComF family protein [Desulfobacterales bacterium]
MGRFSTSRHAFYGVLGALAQALFPARCLACGEPVGLVGQSAATAASPLAGMVCDACAGNVQPVGSPLCLQCGMMFKSREGPDHLCQDCMTRPRRFFRARAAGIYHKSLMSLVLALKYRGKTRVAEPLGRWLFETFVDHWAAGEIDRIVPVPLHARRFRSRGFNQAYLLIRRWPDMAREMAEAAPSWQVVRDVLVRNRPTASQTGLDRRARTKNVRGAFAVPRPEAVAGRRILLVDDVMTTGATADACARVLRTAGAERVDVLTLARANRF